jgi:hypothetical protein
MLTIYLSRRLKAMNVENFVLTPKLTNNDVKSIYLLPRTAADFISGPGQYRFYEKGRL